MKKLTAGIMTVMLGLVMADANAAITSKKYVDDAVKAVTDNVTTLNTEVTEFKEGINTTINTRITEELKEGGALAGLEGRVAAAEDDIDALEVLVGGEESGLVADVAGLQTTVAGLTTGDSSVDKKIENALGAYTTTTDLEETYATKEALTTEQTTRANADKAITDTIGTLPEGTVTVAAGLTALQGKIDAINSDENGILKQAKDYTDGEIDAVNDTIGEVAEGTTVVGMIDAVETAYKAADKDLDDAVKAAQADATQALAESIQKVEAENSDGEFVLTMKKNGDKMEFAWEDISRGNTENQPK